MTIYLVGFPWDFTGTRMIQVCSHKHLVLSLHDENLGKLGLLLSMAWFSRENLQERKPHDLGKSMSRRWWGPWIVPAAGHHACNPCGMTPQKRGHGKARWFSDVLVIFCYQTDEPDPFWIPQVLPQTHSWWALWILMTIIDCHCRQIDRWINK